MKKSANFRSALVNLGNELVNNELVGLSKKAGLSKQDINILALHVVHYTPLSLSISKLMNMS